MITEIQLKQMMPGARANIWIAPLNAAMNLFGINTSARIAAFLAQVAHESTELNVLEENLNYSAEGLMKMWPQHFPNIQIAHRFKQNPEKIANLVYANKLGNGDTISGDGWKFRGRGPIQITGLENYKKIGKLIGVTIWETPDIVVAPHFGSLVAAGFWALRKLNDLADKSQFTEITIRVCGSKTGIESRLNYWKKIQMILK